MYPCVRVRLALTYLVNLLLVGIRVREIPEVVCVCVVWVSVPSITGPGCTF